MYQTPRQLPELEAQTVGEAIVYRASTPPGAGPWQYRLYAIGPDAPEAAVTERGKFLLVRIDESEAVQEVAGPRTLLHQHWGEQLLDRLWEELDNGELPVDATDVDALAAVEQRIAAEILSGPEPTHEVTTSPAKAAASDSANAPADNQERSTSDVPESTEDFTPGDIVWHRDEDSSQDGEEEPLEAVFVRLSDESEDALLVQDVDGDDEPYLIHLDMVVAHERPSPQQAADSVRFRPRGQEDLAPSGRVARIRANIAALRALHTLRDEQRLATPAEQAVLARWSSWGAVPEIFDPRKREFAGLRGELRSLLSEREWYAAEATTRNAHFTDAALVEPIWQALKDLGFEDGRLLEPGCGSGNFLAFAPETAQMTGVELDPVTAEIAAVLYPDADVRAESFVDTRFPEGYFDGAIGNVPFDEVALIDPVHNPLRLPTHNHFIVKALEMVRPGGLVAVLTSRFTLDSMGKTSRLEIADRADLVGAVRLPAGAHRKAAGTNAVSDLLILRRRDGQAPDTLPEWLGLAPVQVDAETKVLVNSYFAKHPECVLGTLSVTNTQYGRKDITVRPDADTPLAEALTGVLATITRQARESGLTMSASPDALQRAEVERRAERMRRAQEMFGEELSRFEGTLLDQKDGTFLQLVGGELTERSVFKNSVEELRSLLSLRDTYVELLSVESSGDDERATTLRQQLNERYDAHVGQYDFLNRRDTRRDRRSAQGCFRTDPYAAGVYALEIYDKEANSAKKSPIFTRAVSTPKSEQHTADTPHDALAISLNTSGEIRLSEIARLLGIDSLDETRDALGELVYNEPGSQRLIPAAEYLSGNVRQKIEHVEKILQMVSDGSRSQHPFQANLSALRRVLPPDKQPGDIEDIQFGATWVKPKFYEQFLRQLMQTRHLTVTRDSGADWEIEAPPSVRKSRAATKVYGTAKRNAIDLAQRMLRRASLVVHPPRLDEDASAQALLDAKRWAAEQTEQTIAKSDEINRLFADWLWQDPERSIECLADYNRLYNSYVPYEGDGSHLTFPGLSDVITPRPHQRAGVARALAEPGGSFFDYEVGFGKTLTIAMTLMEMKRLRMVNKPCIVVKNATVNDFRNDFLKAYPGARVLAIDSSEFTKETAAAYVAQIANGDWDAVILPQSLFKRIPVSGRGQEQFVADQTAEYRARIHQVLTGSDEALSAELNPGEDPLVSEALDTVAALGGIGGLAPSKDTVKKLQGDLKRHTQRAEKNLVKQTVSGISWEQTGIDFIAVDEVQDFANGEVGANNSELALPVSAQAKDLKVKIRRTEKAYGPKAALGSTGTPFPNAMPQAFVMMDYFRRDLLVAAEIEAFSSFQAQYLMDRVSPEISPEGIPRMKERIGAFRNALSFHVLWKTMADVKTRYDIQLPVPKHVSTTDVVDATHADREYMEDIAFRAEIVRAGDVDASEDNLLKISNDGRLAAMDLRMVGKTPDGPGKIDAAADKIFQIYQEYKDRAYTDREGVPSALPGALQLVFADRGTPSDENRKAGKFIAYDYLKDELVERGIPAGQIRFAQEAKNAEEKEALWAACRRGQVAVVIGSTDTMGVGVNVQDRAIALHHLDCPWRPSDVTQREGRIVRQFNQHFEQNVPVQIFRWVKEGSFDSFMWQTVERKARFIDQVRTGRDLEEQDRALDGDLGKDYLEFGEIKAIATGNPLLLKKMQAEEEVRQLEAAYTNWKRTNQHLRNVVDTGDETLAKAQENADLVGRAAGARTETKGDAFRMELPNGKFVTKRQDAATALRTQLALMQRQMRGADASSWGLVATLGGQEFHARINAFHDYLDFSIRGLRDVPQTTFTVSDVNAVLSDGKPPLGLITRMENQAEKLDGLHATLLAVVDELKQEIDRAQKLVDQPFTKADKLRRARADLVQLEAEIDIQAGAGRGDEAGDDPSSGSGKQDSGAAEADELIQAFQDWRGTPAFVMWRLEAHESGNSSAEDTQRRLVEAAGNALFEEIRQQRQAAKEGGTPDFRALTQSQALLDAATAYLGVLDTVSDDDLQSDAQEVTRELIYGVRDYLADAAERAPSTSAGPVTAESTPHTAEPTPAQARPEQGPRPTAVGPAAVGSGPYLRAAEPYADRTEYWTAEQSTLDTYRAWAEEFGFRLNDGSPQEQAIARAARQVLAASQRTRHGRLLGFESFVKWEVGQALADAARVVADQWDREQRGPEAVSRTWEMNAAVRDHFARYRATTEDPQSAAFLQWAGTDEPITLHNEEALEFIRGLSLFDEYTVTGPDGMRTEPATGVDLAAGIAQLIADNAAVEETDSGLTLTAPNGMRFEILVADVEGRTAASSTETQAEQQSGADIGISTAGRGALAPAEPEESGTPLHASAEQATSPKPVLQETPGTTRVQAQNLAVLLGPYTDPGELVAGRELVRDTVLQLQEGARQQQDVTEGIHVASLVQDVSEASDALDAAPHVSPAEIFPLYDRLASAASSLPDDTDGDLAQRAHTLLQRTERHLARMHATGRDLFDVLLDASALDTGSWSVLARNDPLKERPAPYTDSSHLTFARQLIFETYDRWPHLYSSTGGEFSDRLRGAMWEIRQTSDRAVGTALPDWMNVVSNALAAAGEADEGVSRSVLRDVAQRSYQHHQSLASFQLAAERSEPYGSERSYTDGADTVAGAWDAWMATRTAAYLVRRETAGASADAAQAHQLSAQEEMREALYAADWAQTDDGSLDEVTRRATKAAHTAYALVLSLGEGSYREREDANVLTRLVRTCYEHAAACRVSAQYPDAVRAVRSQLAERQEQLRAMRPDTAQAATGAEPSALQASSSAVLEIEHHFRGTVVRGVSNEASDAPVRAALERHDFKPSKDGTFWYLPRRMVLTNRDMHVRKLIEDLTRLGRPHQVIDEPPHQEQPEITIPVGEPYAFKAEASQDFEEMFGALWRLRDTPAGRRLITRGRDARPDGEAVWLAMEELRQGPVGSNYDPFVHPADDVVSRCTALAHAALTLARNLEEERYRAPVALPHFRTMTQYATVLASRVTATSAQEGLWEEVFGAAIAVPGTDEGANTTVSGIETTTATEESAPEAAGATRIQVAADLNEPGQAVAPLVAGPYGDEDLRAAVDHLQHMYQQAAQALPTWYRPDGPPGPSGDVEAWYRGPGKIELPEGFVPYSNDRAVLKVGDVIREGYPRWLDSKKPSYKTIVITSGRDPSDGYYRALPNTRVHPREIVAVPTDSRLVTGAEEDRYTIRGTFWDRWKVAEVAGDASGRGELALPATIDAYRQAFMATGALARVLDHTSVPEETGTLLTRLSEATERHIVRLTLTHRVAEENAESEQRRWDQERESQQADEGWQRPSTDRAQKRAEVEAMISENLARTHGTARERAVQAALADPYVRSISDGASKEEMRPRFREWLRVANLPDSDGTQGRFRDWFHASGPGAENDAAAEVFEQVYTELSTAAETTPANGVTVAPEPAEPSAQASGAAEVEPAPKTEREPEPDPPGKAAEIAATARANGWQVTGGWTGGYYSSSTDYELTLKARTARGDRHFVLKWEMKRGRHTFNSQRSMAFHHADKSAKKGFRPKLAVVELEIRALAIETSTSTVSSADVTQDASAQPQADQPAAPTVEQDSLFDAVGDTGLPAASGTPTGIEALAASSAPMGTPLLEEHLRSLPQESEPRPEDDARLAVVTTLSFPDGQVREVLLLLQTIEVDADTGDDPIVRGAQIVPPNDLVATSLNGQWSPADLLAMADSQVLPLAAPIPWRQVERLATLPAHRARLALPLGIPAADREVAAPPAPADASALSHDAEPTEAPEQGDALRQQLDGLGDRLIVGHIGGSMPTGQPSVGPAVPPSAAPHDPAAPVAETAMADEQPLAGPQQEETPEPPPPSEPASEQQQEEESVTVTEPEPTQGPWSSRIKIITDGGATFVTGTGGDFWQQEAELRELLKKNRNFAFRGGRWRYQGRGANRERVLKGIRAFLAAKDAQEEAAVATASYKEFPPTEQQQRIIDAFLAGQDVVVQALAGTGKTSTLQMLTRRAPERRFAYVAFNRSIADEANRKFPNNVTAKTSHSFARSALQNTPMRRKIETAGRNGGARRPKDVAAALGVTEPFEVAKIKGRSQYMGAEDVARVVAGAINRYRQSADAELGPQHLGEKWANSPATATLMDVARRAWADIADPSSDKLFFSHDDYLKLWALTNPRLNFDVILFDEAQDINAVLKKVIQDQSAQTIVVGDSNQQIYEFRGAIDALKGWPADVVLPLTQSWRFGPEVAEVGNAYLSMLGSDLLLEGNPNLDTSLGPVEEPDAVLCRTNVGAISAVFAGFEAGKRVALVGGGRDIEDIAKAAQDLLRGRRTKHPELANFETWREVREYAESDEEAKTLQMFVRLVDRYSPEGLLGMIGDLVPEDARDEETRPELVVSTAHKAKGREWDRVRIGADFPQPKESTETGEFELPSAEELRLAYVTVTRAKQRLEIGSLGWMHDIGDDAPRHADQTAVSTRPEQQTKAETEPVPEPTKQAPAIAESTAASTAATELVPQEARAADDRQDTDTAPTPGQTPQAVSSTSDPKGTGAAPVPDGSSSLTPNALITMTADESGTLLLSVGMPDGSTGQAQAVQPDAALADIPLPHAIELPALVRRATSAETLVATEEVAEWLGQHMPDGPLAEACRDAQVLARVTEAARDSMRDAMAPAAEDIAAWLTEAASENSQLLRMPHTQTQAEFTQAFASVCDDLIMDGGSEYLLWTYLGQDGAQRDTILDMAAPQAYQTLRQRELPALPPPTGDPAPEPRVQEVGDLPAGAAEAEAASGTEDETTVVIHEDGESRTATETEITELLGGMTTADGVSFRDLFNESLTEARADGTSEAESVVADASMTRDAQERIAVDYSAVGRQSAETGGDGPGDAQHSDADLAQAAHVAPLPWDQDKIRKRTQAGIRRGASSGIPNLARDISQAVGDSQARTVWEQDHPFAQYETNLHHTLAAFDAQDTATRSLVEEVATQLQGQLGQFATRAAEHYNTLIAPNSGDPILLAALDEQLTADNRLPELNNPFVREALILVLHTIDESERTARSRRLKPAVVRNAIDQVVGLAGSTSVDGELFPHVDAALASVKVQLDVARELMAEMGLNATVLDKYTHLRGLITHHQEKAVQAQEPTGSSAAPQQDGTAVAEAAQEQHITAPGPLTDRDVAAALGRISNWDFGRLILEIDNSRRRFPDVHDGYFRLPVGPGNEEGLERGSAYSSRSGLDIEISGASDTKLRAGRATWNRALAWIAPALTPLRRDLTVEAWRTSNLLERTKDAFLASGEYGRYSAAHQEVRDLLGFLKETIIAESLEAHLTGQAESLTAHNRLAAQDADDSLISVNELVAPESVRVRVAEEAALERVKQMQAVMPERHTGMKLLREVEPGDAFWQVSPQHLPFVVRQRPVAQGDQVIIEGDLVTGAGQFVPYTWTRHGNSLDDVCQPLLLPQSLGGLVDLPADGPDPAAPSLAQTRMEAERGTAESATPTPHIEQQISYERPAEPSPTAASTRGEGSRQPEQRRTLLPDRAAAGAAGAPAGSEPTEQTMPGAPQSAETPEPYGALDHYLVDLDRLRRTYEEWTACETGQRLLEEARELRAETGVDDANEAGQIEKRLHSILLLAVGMDTDPQELIASYEKLASAGTEAGRSLDRQMGFASVDDRRLLQHLIAQAKEQAARLTVTTTAEGMLNGSVQGVAPVQDLMDAVAALSDKSLPITPESGAPDQAERHAPSAAPNEEAAAAALAPNGSDGEYLMATFEPEIEGTMGADLAADVNADLEYGFDPWHDVVVVDDEPSSGVSETVGEREVRARQDFNEPADAPSEAAEALTATAGTDSVPGGEGADLAAVADADLEYGFDAWHDAIGGDVVVVDDEPNSGVSETVGEREVRARQDFNEPVNTPSEAAEALTATAGPDSVPDGVDDTQRSPELPVGTDRGQSADSGTEEEPVATPATGMGELPSSKQQGTERRQDAFRQEVTERKARFIEGVRTSENSAEKMEDDLDLHFENVRAMIADVGTGTETSSSNMTSGSVGQVELGERYTELRGQLSSILGSVGAEPILEQPGDPVEDAADAAGLDAAMGGAQQEAGSYWGTPEWEMIRQVSQAAQSLRVAVREAVGEYAETTVRDIRVYGLNRAIQARTARAVSHASFLLARRLDRGGQRDSGAWRAVWRLHRAAATRADRLTGLLPSGQRVDLADQLRGAWQWLAARLPNRGQTENGEDATPGRVQRLMARGFETIRHHYRAATERLGDLARHPVWKRVASAFESARETFDRARLGMHRLSEDAATLGTGRMLWVRTVEMIAHGVRTLLERLARNGGRDGLRWNALRVLHHAAEEHVSHLRGYLPDDARSPLGTYYEPDGMAADLPDATAQEPRDEPASIAQPQDDGRRPEATGDVDFLRDAVELVTTTNLVNPLILQRRFRIGHQESGALLASMEALGIISAPTEGKRAVLMGPEEAVRAVSRVSSAQLRAALSGELQPGGSAPPGAMTSPAVASVRDSAPIESTAHDRAPDSEPSSEAPSLPQRRRTPESAIGAASTTARTASPDAVSAAGRTSRDSAEDRAGSTQRLLQTQAGRLRDRGVLARATATNPTEERKANLLFDLADKTEAAAQRLATPKGGGARETAPRDVMAEPFLAALRAHAAARGAALPDDVVQSAWAAALKATAATRNQTPEPVGAAAGAAPNGPQRRDRHVAPEQQYHQHGHAPSTPGMR